MSGTEVESQLTEAPPARRAANRPRLWGAAILALIALGSFIRIQAARSDDSYNPRDATGLLRTDPALLYYFCQRIVESGGGVPADFHADPNIEYPQTTDIARIETPAQEFLVAWTHLLLGKRFALHVVGIYVMGICASLAVVGVFGLTYELTRSTLWASMAGLLYVVIPANYRTIGFVFIREDLSLPLLAFHLWMLARCARVRSNVSFVLAGVSLVGAVATWHAMSFIVAVEATCIFIWFVRSGSNPLATPGAWIVPVVAVAGSLLVPVLRSKQFALSVPMQIAAGLLAAGIAQRRGVRSRPALVVLALLGWGLMMGASLAASRWTQGGLSDFSHVFALMLAKVRYLGIKPTDPLALSPEARLLWTGPFVTGGWHDIVIEYPIAIAALWFVIPALVRGFSSAGVDHRPGVMSGQAVVLLLGFIAFLVLGYLVQRLFVMIGLLAPAAAAVALRWRKDADGFGIGAMLIGTVAQGIFFAWLVLNYVNPWYFPPARNEAQAHMIAAVRRSIPVGAPIAADFVTSATILAHTRHPVIQQPKYETLRSRERILRFINVFCNGTPQQFAELVRSYGCRYVVIDAPFMWQGCRYIAGIPESQTIPTPGTAASYFCSGRGAVVGRVPGFKILYRTPVFINFDTYRIYEVE
ncbi:MAG: hypothetical protein ACREJC_01105 [Tepidisphaeraceae bacterium]